MTPAPPRAAFAPLDADRAARLDRDGFLLLRGAIPAGAIAPLRAAFEAGELPGGAWPVPRGADWRHARVDLDPAVRAICRLPVLLAGAAHRLAAPFFLMQVEGREPRPGGGAQLLHRDAPASVPPRFVSALAFLDPFGPANGATCVVAGTHRGEGLAAPAGAAHPAAQVIAGEAGDVLLFDAALLHGATRNSAGAPRRALLITWAAQAELETQRQTKALRAIRMEEELFSPPAVSADANEGAAA